MGAVEEILDSAEHQARDCIRQWKHGAYRGESVLDDDGHGIEDIHIRATVTKTGDALTVDLSDSHAQVIGFVNSSFPSMMSAVQMALAFLICRLIILNERAEGIHAVLRRSGSARSQT